MFELAVKRVLKLAFVCLPIWVLTAACSALPKAVVTPGVTQTPAPISTAPTATFLSSDAPTPTATLSAPLVRSLAYDPLIARMMAQVQSSALYTYTGSLSGEWPALIGGELYTITTRYTGSGQPIHKATQYVYEHLRARGVEASYHDWATDSFPGRNVIGVITGTLRPDEIVLLTAHLDGVAIQVAPYESGPAPGADDNASGAAGLLVAADILSRYQFERTLRFAFFTGEEQGLLGSKEYAGMLKRAGENVVAVCNLDMIAYDGVGGPSFALIARPDSADLAIADVFSDVVSIYGLNLMPTFAQVGYRVSDHVAFRDQGYAAIMVIEDMQSDFNPYYHSRDDRLSHLNLAYFTNMVQAVVGAAAHLGGLD